MIPRPVPAVIARAVLAAALGAGTLHGQAGTVPVPAVEPHSAAKAVNPGFLFSALSFADSPLGAEWSRLRGEAQARFPELKLTEVADLHVTVVYIGGGWKREDLNRIRALALVAPPAAELLTPEVVRMGAHDQAVVVELRGASRAWGDAVATAKGTLNRLGLKQPEAYDSNFRSHLTFAEARHSPPNPADLAELAGFQSWLTALVAREPRKFTVTVGPATPVVLLLAGATRPRGAPEYIPVDDFLHRHPAASPGNDGASGQ